MSLFLPFLNQIRDAMTKGKHNPRKLTHSQDNSQIKLVM
jgi:hypothetical protein